MKAPKILLVLLVILLFVLMATGAKAQSFYIKKKHFRRNTEHLSDFKRPYQIYHVSILKWLPHRKQWVGGSSRLNKTYN